MSICVKMAHICMHSCELQLELGSIETHSGKSAQIHARPHGESGMQKIPETSFTQGKHVMQIGSVLQYITSWHCQHAQGAWKWVE